MKLRFHAKTGRVHVPGLKLVGAVPRIVGRKHLPGDGTKTAATHPVDEDGFVIDDADPNKETRSAAEALKRKCRMGDLWPADEATAAACGVAFVKLELGADGEWQPAAAKPPATRKASHVTEG